MSRRLAFFAVLTFLVGLVALFPLRVALWDLGSQGFSARRVGGTIWHGRIDELKLERIRLGTFEGGIEPMSALTGQPVLAFSRMEDPDGPLTGNLRLGSVYGIQHGTGRIAANGLFGAVPVTDLLADDLTLLFKGGQCDTATGRLTILVKAPMPGLGGNFSGGPVCDGKLVRVVLNGPAGSVLEIQVASDGHYRAWLRAKAGSADAADALIAAGFRQSAGGMVLSSAGTL